MNWAHVLTQLLWGYHHLTAGHGLLRFYERHNAVAFLRSGRTSESPGSDAAAKALLHWLTFRFGAGHHGLNPLDW